MASIRKFKKGYRAEVQRQGVRRSKVFPSKREAQDWAARQEYLIVNEGKLASRQSFGEVMDRYAREVSQGKRGARWEIIRLEKLGHDRIAKIPIGDLSPADLGDWRDRRLREVAPASVRREMNLLSAVLSQARREWGLITVSPMTDVRKIPAPGRRVRRPTAEEIERLAHSAGSDLTNKTARVFHAWLFAIETAMRAGEIVGLRWEDIEGRVAHLPKTKNGDARDVPLSSEAVRLLEALPRMDPVFGLTTAQVDALWRKLRDRAGVEDLRFHDSRHHAITELSKKLDVLELARMVGHRDLKMLLVYYEGSAADMAKKLG